MTGTADTARDDLAYLRGILDERRPGLRMGGLLYAAAGLIYGGQVLVSAAALSGFAGLGDGVHGPAAIVANALYAAVIAIAIWQNRGAPPMRGTATRTLSTAFAGVGIANGVAAIAFAIAGSQLPGWNPWLIFPITVCAFQGAAWLILAAVTRRAWMACIAAGWFLTAPVLAALLGSLDLYLFALAAALLAFMALPGAVLFRAASHDRS